MVDKNPYHNADSGAYGPEYQGQPGEVSQANKRQEGGDHYRRLPGEQHWDRAIRLGWDPFQYQITKYVERWKDKGGVSDLEKARHFIDKYIENWPAFQRPPKAVNLYEPDSLAIMEKELEKVKPLYDMEGVWGNGVSLFTCVKCRAQIKAPSIFHADREHHEVCPGPKYLDQ